MSGYFERQKSITIKAVQMILDEYNRKSKKTLVDKSTKF